MNMINICIKNPPSLELLSSEIAELIKIRIFNRVVQFFSFLPLNLLWTFWRKGKLNVYMKYTSWFWINEVINTLDRDRFITMIPPPPTPTHYPHHPLLFLTNYIFFFFQILFTTIKSHTKILDFLSFNSGLFFLPTLEFFFQIQCTNHEL